MSKKSTKSCCLFGDSVFECLGGVHFGVGYLLESVDLVLGRLQQEPDPVGVVVHDEVGQSFASVGVDEAVQLAFGLRTQYKQFILRSFKNLLD